MIPMISSDVILTTLHEINREGLAPIVQKIEELSTSQPYLSALLFDYLNRTQFQHGIQAAEVTARLLMVLYKVIDAQLEVNALEER